MIVIVIDILFQSNTPYRNIFCISQNNASTSLEDAFHLSLFHMMLPLWSRPFTTGHPRSRSQRQVSGGPKGHLFFSPRREFGSWNCWVVGFINQTGWYKPFPKCHNMSCLVHETVGLLGCCFLLRSVCWFHTCSVCGHGWWSRYTHLPRWAPILEPRIPRSNPPETTPKNRYCWLCVNKYIIEYIPANSSRQGRKKCLTCL